MDRKRCLWVEKRKRRKWKRIKKSKTRNILKCARGAMWMDCFRVDGAQNVRMRGCCWPLDEEM